MGLRWDSCGVGFGDVGLARDFFDVIILRVYTDPLGVCAWARVRWSPPPHMCLICDSHVINMCLIFGQGVCVGKSKVEDTKPVAYLTCNAPPYVINT